MNKNELKAFFDGMTPDGPQKTRMLRRILEHKAIISPGARRRKILRYAVIPSAVCAVFVCALLILQPFGGGTVAYALYSRALDGTVYKLADPNNPNSSSVSLVDTRPGLEFYIEGKDIAKIELSCQNEVLYAVDCTKTQDEKWWNSEKYQEYDAERKVSIFHPELLYQKSITLQFNENFKDYQDIWYRWTAYNLYNWASEDNYSHFLMQPIPENLTEDEKREMAAGQFKGFPEGVGHIQLDGYPKELTEDTITITVTDRQGHSATTLIKVKVSNNEQRQTVVTANLIKEAK